MACSSITSKMAQRSTSLLLRESSLGAFADRYSVIRSFFRQQQVLASPHRNPPNRSTPHTQSSSRTSSPPGPSALLRHTRALVGQYRPFHSTVLTRNLLPNQPPEKPAHDKDETPKTDAESTSSSQETKTPTSTPPSSPPTPPPPPRNLENYSRFYQRLATSLPHLHRPTRDDFLKVASGFWQRARIRFKWFTIKSFRKFNADDMSAFFTWFLMSQTLWILVGTTTFFSVIFAILNSLRLQETVAHIISNYLTSETGVTIIFESAIVPKWKDSRISFKNVYISRRPPPPSLSETTQPLRKKTGHLAVGYDVSNHPAIYHQEDDEDEQSDIIDEEDDYNWSMFDLNVDSIDVTLSLWRWLDGKGLVEDAVIKGVRGVLDRRSVHYDPLNPLNPLEFRHPATPGSFELQSLQLEDVLITVYQPNSFRPYTASIFRADIRSGLRKQWLFYDLLCAENVVGQFDNCLFSLHRPQSIGRTTEKDLKDGDWARMSRIRIDGVNIDHLNRSTTTDEGPISWITSGKVDAVLDIKFPRDPHDDMPFNAILGEIADAITTSLNGESDPARDRIPGQRELAKPPLSAPETVGATGSTMENKEGADPGSKVIVDIDLRFRDLKAAVPVFTKELSYVNNALIRPIVAFVNANRTLVPIHCKIVKDLSDFDGAWTMWETGLIDEISLKTYEALAYHVTQANMNRRIKTNAMDPMSAHIRDSYAAATANGRSLLYDNVSPI